MINVKSVCIPYLLLLFDSHDVRQRWNAISTFGIDIFAKKDQNKQWYVPKIINNSVLGVKHGAQSPSNAHSVQHSKQIP